MAGRRRRRRYSQGSFFQDFFSDAIDAAQDTVDEYASRDYPEAYEEHLKETPPEPDETQESPDAAALQEAITQVRKLTESVHRLAQIVDEVARSAPPDEDSPSRAAPSNAKSQDNNDNSNETQG